jgi:hypothetical protein
VSGFDGPIEAFAGIVGFDGIFGLLVSSAAIARLRPDRSAAYG